MRKPPQALDPRLSLDAAHLVTEPHCVVHVELAFRGVLEEARCG